jgi:hypothetical protein
MSDATPTDRPGTVLHPFTEPTGNPANWLLCKPEDRCPNGVLRCWMGARFWDDENAGTWSAGHLMIACKPDPLTPASYAAVT